jgi:4-amino-4-deoxy-L-arabinose transferase-like glycosyltransferase
VSRQALLRAVGALLVVVGVTLPRAWYDRLPWGAELPPQPIRGVTLLQLAFVLEGLALLWLARRARSWTALAPAARAPLAPPPADTGEPLDGRRATLVLAAITALGLALRLLGLGSDLWLDEITPIRDYLAMPAIEVFASYQRSNNHLLQTLWMKAGVALFGESEWAVRLLPALLGAATVPALYALARQALSRGPALGAALLLALSYHHVFFSQNARGYAGYLLCAALATTFLVRALRDDRFRDWAWYVACLVLAFAFQLLTAFVVAAHAIVGLAALVGVARRGGPARPLAGRLAAVYAVTGLLVFHLYAAIIPQAWVVAGTTYSRATAGFAPFSLEFAREVARGLAAGFGPGLLLGAVPFLALTAAGFAALWRRQWILAGALALPPVVTLAFLIVRGYSISPRFFLLAIPLAMLCVAQGLFGLAGLLARARTAAVPRVAWGLTLVVALAAAAALPGYYRVPKQDYRGAIAFLEGRRAPGDVVIVFGIAESGTRYYLRRMGVAGAAAYRFTRTEAGVDSLVAARGTGTVWFATTFPRDLRLRAPRLAERLRDTEWTLERRFPGSVGDGAVIVWRRS